MQMSSFDAFVAQPEFLSVAQRRMHRTRSHASWLFPLSVLLFPLLPLSGCSSHSRPPAFDAGDAGDGGLEPPNPCVDAGTTTVCSGLETPSVTTCQGGVPIEQTACPSGAMCVAGQCISPACNLAQSLRDGTGCSFFTVHADGVGADQPTVLVVANPVHGLEAHVEVDVRSLETDPLMKWQAVTSAAVAAGTSVRLTADVPAPRGVGAAPHFGLRVVSDQPVTVMHLQEDESYHHAATARGTTLLPTHMLGTEYRAATFPQKKSALVERVDTEGEGAGLLVLVGTQDGTTVQLTLPPAGAALTNPNGVASPGGTKFAVSLQEGDVYQLTTARSDADLSATIVSSNKPLAVFSGNFATDYGTAPDASRLVFADGTYEAMLPVDEWVRTWLVGWLAPFDFCDSFFGAKPGSSYRILVMTAQAPATVSFTGPTGNIFPVAKQTIPANTLQTFSLTKPDESPVFELVQVASDEKIWVAQALDCAPALVPGVPLPLVLRSYVLGFPEGFASHRVAVISGDNTQVQLDGRDLKVLGSGQEHSQGLGYQVTYLDSSDLGVCKVGETVGCTHVLTGQGEFGVSWRGAASASSYGTSAMALPCDHRIDSCP